MILSFQEFQVSLNILTGQKIRLTKLEGNLFPTRGKKVRMTFLVSVVF